MDIKVAVLVDGSFFIKRLFFYKRKFFESAPDLTGEQMSEALMSTVKKHLYSNINEVNYHLHRIYFYDAPPLDIKIHHPLPDAPGENCKVKDYQKDPQTILRKDFLASLKKQRKVAVRLGTTKHEKKWKLTGHSTKAILKGEKSFDDLDNSDFYHEVRQKGVDIKLGIDIASLAYEKHVDKILLIAGDSDFVPAAKLARVHGIDFVLDPLRNNIDPRLHEHIDGLDGYDLVSILKDAMNTEPDIRPQWWNELPRKSHNNNKGNRQNPKRKVTKK